MIGEEYILDFFSQFGPFALALLSFTEAIIQPIPPDVMFVPMAYEERNNPSVLLWLWAIVTLFSVLGAIVGHTIGKRYRRHDEAGTPYCLTIDGQTKEDGSVTIRDRDTMKQKRISSKEVVEIIRGKLMFS